MDIEAIWMVSATVSTSITKNVVGPSSLSMVIGTFKLSNLTTSLCKFSAHSSESGSPKTKKSSKLTVKMFHTISLDYPLYSIGNGSEYFRYLRPKGSAASMYTISSHFIPKRWQSSGCIGTILSALLMLINAS